MINNKMGKKSCDNHIELTTANNIGGGGNNNNNNAGGGGFLHTLSRWGSFRKRSSFRSIRPATTTTTQVKSGKNVMPTNEQIMYSRHKSGSCDVISPIEKVNKPSANVTTTQIEVHQYYAEPSSRRLIGGAENNGPKPPIKYEEPKEINYNYIDGTFKDEHGGRSFPSDPMGSSTPITSEILADKHPSMQHNDSLNNLLNESGSLAPSLNSTQNGEPHKSNAVSVVDVDAEVARLFEKYKNVNSVTSSSVTGTNISSRSNSDHANSISSLSRSSTNAASNDLIANTNNTTTTATTNQSCSSPGPQSLISSIYSGSIHSYDLGPLSYQQQQPQSQQQFDPTTPDLSSSIYSVPNSMPITPRQPNIYETIPVGPAANESNHCVVGMNNVDSASINYSNFSAISPPAPLERPAATTSAKGVVLTRASSFTSSTNYAAMLRAKYQQQRSDKETGMLYVLQHLQNKYPQYDILNRYSKSRNNRSGSQKGSANAIEMAKKVAGAEHLVDGKRQSSSGGRNVFTSQQQQQYQQQQQQQQHTLPGHNPNRSSSTTPFDRNYYNFQTNQPSILFDEDPGIMSEIETSATGFRRGGKIRSSLPVVRTPSKSQDRSLGLVFLQFRTETKRALLPNEITSIDTVKALFVRSFPRQLTMEYLDHVSVRIYIHDPVKDMFYELEDLKDVKDKSIIRIYEQGVNGPQPGGGQALPMAISTAQQGFIPSGPDVENYGYFSEPEFDSEYQSQHVHRKRFPSPLVGQSMLVGPNPAAVGQSQYYGTIMFPPQYRSATLGPRTPGFLPPGQPLPPPQPLPRNKAFPGYSQTLPRGTHLMSPTALTASLSNPFGFVPGQPAPPKPQRNFNPQAPGLIMIQGMPPRPGLPSPVSGAQMAPPPSTAPGAVISGQQIVYHQNRPLPDRPYSVAGHYPTLDRNGQSPRLPFPPPGGVPSGVNATDFSGYLSSPEHRPRAALMDMNAGHPRSSFSGFPSEPMANNPAALLYPNSAAINLYGQRPPAAAAVDADARVRMQEMEKQIASLTNVVSKAFTVSKPTPPPKPSTLSGYRSDGASLPEDSVNQLRVVKRRTRELRSEIRGLRRFAVQQTNQSKENLKTTCNKIKTQLAFLNTSDAQLRLERLHISSQRDSYNSDVARLDKDLLELEAQVEELRSNVINRRCRVNMSSVESMALILSRASKTVADLKARYPAMAQTLKNVMALELQQIEREEKFLKDEPDRLEHSLKRCKKLTGTLVTLKRLASVQEQRSSGNANTSSPSQLLADKKDSSGDENSAIGALANSSGRDAFMTRANRMQAWRRSANFRQAINKHNYKIDLYRGFTSMPTIQEPNNVDENNEEVEEEEVVVVVANKKGPEKETTEVANNKRNAACAGRRRCLSSIGFSSSSRRSMPSAKNYESDLLVPHTVIQVTPATPSSTDSSRHSTNILENLLDELQTFSREMPTSSTSNGGLQRSSGSLRGNKAAAASLLAGSSPSDTIARNEATTSAARSKSYSSLRANSEPPGNNRPRGSSIPDGTLDLNHIALLSNACGNAAAATAALVEKHFAQSRQELLEQRHQELLKKQRQLQEQYTRLQQLSRGQIPRGYMSELKKTGSESNLAMKGGGVVGGGGEAGHFEQASRTLPRGVLLSSTTVHGSLRNLASSSSSPVTTTANIKTNGTNEAGTKKVFETEIL